MQKYVPIARKALRIWLFLAAAGAAVLAIIGVIRLFALIALLAGMSPRTFPGSLGTFGQGVLGGWRFLLMLALLLGALIFFVLVVLYRFADKAGPSGVQVASVAGDLIGIEDIRWLKKPEPPVVVPRQPPPGQRPGQPPGQPR